MRLILHLLGKELIVHVRKQFLGPVTGAVPLTLRAEYGMVLLLPSNGALSAAGVAWIGEKEGGLSFT